MTGGWVNTWRGWSQVSSRFEPPHPRRSLRSVDFGGKDASQVRGDRRFKPTLRKLGHRPTLLGRREAVRRRVRRARARAEKLLVQGAEQAVMTDEQHGLARSTWSAIWQRPSATGQSVCGHCSASGGRMVLMGCSGAMPCCALDLVDDPALESAEAAFLQVVIEVNRKPQPLRDESRGLAGARERARDDAVDPLACQALRPRPAPARRRSR